MSPVLPGEGEPPCDAASDRSEAESISEEERVRRLFAICDADGDGFIDRYLWFPCLSCEPPCSHDFPQKIAART